MKNQIKKILVLIKSSNLCAEIVEYSDNTQTAVCNLASIALPKFIDKKNKKYDYKKLYETSQISNDKFRSSH